MLHSTEPKNTVQYSDTIIVVVAVCVGRSFATQESPTCLVHVLLHALFLTYSLSAQLWSLEKRSDCEESMYVLPLFTAAALLYVSTGKVSTFQQVESTNHLATIPVVVLCRMRYCAEADLRKSSLASNGSVST